MTKIHFALFAVILCIAFACSDDIATNQEHQPKLPDVPFDYVQNVNQVEQKLGEGISFDINETNVEFSSPHFRTEVTSNEIATLGRVLFYDNRLSRNNSIACASCHRQEIGFSDNADVSVGFGGVSTERNSMSIANPIMNETFFWDGRSRSLRDLSLQPVFNHVEMGIESTDQLVAKIKEQPYYSKLFSDAFGSTVVNRERISDALGQFVASIVKADARFDEGLDNDFQDFSELEKHGMALFFSDATQCSSCHNGVNFSSPTGFTNDNPYSSTSGTTNIGLDVVYDDPGFASGKFKIPSLRNIALTAPYMHDGRFQNLREVLDHYNENIQPHTDLDPKLKTTAGPIKLRLTELDLDALEAFLFTLTSKTIASDESLSNPFQT